MVRCHPVRRWGSLSVLIRIHGCWDLSLTNLALLCSLASLTGYWSGPMPSPLIQAMHPELPACAWGPDLYEKSRTAGGHLVWLTPHIHVVLSLIVYVVAACLLCILLMKAFLFSLLGNKPILAHKLHNLSAPEMRRVFTLQLQVCVCLPVMC